MIGSNLIRSEEKEWDIVRDKNKTYRKQNQRQNRIEYEEDIEGKGWKE